MLLGVRLWWSDAGGVVVARTPCWCADRTSISRANAATELLREKRTGGGAADMVAKRSAVHVCRGPCLLGVWKKGVGCRAVVWPFCCRQSGGLPVLLSC